MRRPTAEPRFFAYFANSAAEPGSIGADRGTLNSAASAARRPPLTEARGAHSRLGGTVRGLPLGWQRT